MSARTGAYAFENGYLCIVDDMGNGIMKVALCHPKELNLYHGPVVAVPGQPGKFYRRSGWLYGQTRLNPSSMLTEPIIPLNYYAELGKQGVSVNGVQITSRDSSPFETFAIQFPPPGNLASLMPMTLIGSNRRWGGRVGSSERMLLINKIVPACAPDTDARFARCTGIWRVASFILIVFAQKANGAVLALLGHNEMSSFGHKNPVEFETVFMVGAGRFSFVDGKVRLHARLFNFYRNMLNEPSLEEPVFSGITVMFPDIERGEIALANGVEGHGIAAWPVGASSFPIELVKKIDCQPPPSKLMIA